MSLLWTQAQAIQREAMPWYQNPKDTDVDPKKALPVKKAGYAGYVGDSSRDDEMFGHGSDDDFDEDLWDHATPEPTHEEEQHHEEHGEYPDSHYDRHEKAYEEALHQKRAEDTPDHDDPELHIFVGEHGSNNALWQSKGHLGRVDLTGPVYATQSHVNQHHIDRYLADPADESHTNRTNPAAARVRQQHGLPEYLADTHPMFVTHEGRLHVTDGHHRVAAALQSGQRSIIGWHYDGDKHGLPGYEDDDED